MANKPMIYGFDDAGCKWETMHKEDIQSAIDGSENDLKTYTNNLINNLRTEVNKILS